MKCFVEERGEEWSLGGVMGMIDGVEELRNGIGSQHIENMDKFTWRTALLKC